VEGIQTLHTIHNIVIRLAKFGRLGRVIVEGDVSRGRRAIGLALTSRVLSRWSVEIL
jgi:hypothetical protein